MQKGMLTDPKNVFLAPRDDLTSLQSLGKRSPFKVVGLIY